MIYRNKITRENGCNGDTDREINTFNFENMYETIFAAENTT